MRKHKLGDLPRMFESQANIQSVANTEIVQNNQRHWQRSLRGNSFRGSWFGNGFRQSQPYAGRWPTQESHGRRFQGNEGYAYRGKETEQKVSGAYRRDDRQQNSMQGNQTRSGGAYRQNDLIYLSKTMSRLLRHEALKAGLRMQADGFVFVSELLQCKAIQGHFTEADVRRVTEDNDKQRFQLKVDPVSQKLMVKANQGHSLTIPNLELISITEAGQVPAVIHGTFLDILPTIQQQGLSRMKRTHIHFAVGKAEDKSVISGMRRNCEVLIYIDIGRALKDGIQFFQSANGVVLSPGNERGIIPPEYFHRIEFPQTGINRPKNALDSTRKRISHEYEAEEAGPWKNKKQRRE